MSNPGRVSTLVPWISDRQIDFWVRRGYVRPQEQHPGSGNPRSFSRAEERVLLVMSRLVLAGIPPELASRIARKAIEISVRDTSSTVRLRISNEEDPGIAITIDGL